MSRKVVLRTSSQPRQPFLPPAESYRKAGTRLGEAVGGTAAVCCCCPCGLANIMYLAIYKVPATLCLKALKRKRRRRLIQNKRDALCPPPQRCSCGCCDDIGARVFPLCSSDDDVSIFTDSEKEDKEVMELEKEMWDRFYSTGFWRSPSQRDNTNNSSLPSHAIPASISAPNLHVLMA
ncbi:hypothetical protein VNO77_15773 [Canavalia gladiata]|uniref:Uncharacterized protein n=1 Tax=Canavalia gladiata TaxID=3824 RepID=A0AAN9QRI4_CANGL